MAPEHFDAVVVGSGFGGSIMAYRLAEAGLRVCVLERGKPYPPGSFPRSPLDMSRNFWDPSRKLYGMYNVWSFRGIGALVSSGLGGGSLIYANVLIRKDEKWFVREDLERGGYESWPVTRAELEPHYDDVERVLGAEPYPLEKPSYDRTHKTHAMRYAADRLGLEWHLPKLAVAFGNPGAEPAPGVPITEAQPNLHSRPRATCRLCGECNFGCNFGSKNTLDYNYLTLAQREGAELRMLCDALGFSPRPEGGYTVRYRELDPERSSRDEPRPPEREVTADRLVLAAGSLATTFLMLKYQEAHGSLGKRLGARFCGNGDLLTFALRCRETGPDGRTEPRRMDPNYGPVITSAIRVGDVLDGGGADGRGFYVEDAGFPALVSWLIEGSQAPGVLRRGLRFSLEWLRERVRPRDPDLGAEVSALIGESVLSSSSLPLLGMGRDVPDGNMTLRRGLLDVDWRTRRSKAYFLRMRETMQEITREWGGRHRANLLWYFNRVITVHPLGGCPIGRSVEEGVVDPFCEVFGHPGLYVADGAAMPGPIGPNPALTIAAIAHRAAERIVERKRP